eukprot:COSAG02_NODE_188_length_30307_cov_341.858746_9_plen_131_part_00
MSSLTRTPQTCVPQPIVISLPHARLHRMRHGIFILVSDCAVRCHPADGCHWVRASKPGSAPYSDLAALEYGAETTSTLGIVMSDAIPVDPLLPTGTRALAVGVGRCTGCRALPRCLGDAVPVRSWLLRVQ